MIEFNFSDIKSDVRKQLAIIGKHHSSPKGGSLFSTTDLTSIEETVMGTFIVASAQMVVAELSAVVTSYAVNDDKLSFEVSPSRWGEALPVAFADSVRSFIIADVIGSVLNMIAPDIAPKYNTDAKSQLAALATIVFTKQQPTPETIGYNLKGTVSLDTDEKKDGYSQI